ncbi:hypothetical protein RJ639_038222 [Escallonia herrerae]|uniref:F-box protein n=1 Tax=Escallonia herrerae TaxID=1293975 RepID=A0AA88WZZ3_9ASTE|nr:hypothetical protein RJ639_038222 [Escallonia herrerae]
MANSETLVPSFSDFPEDVQLCILSFLTPADVAAFACTSKRLVSLCRSDHKLWFSLCNRRWGSKTQIKKWASGKITFKRLYKFLSEHEGLIGFWRRSGHGRNDASSLPPLVFFEWGPTFITGSRVSPSRDGDYSVTKAPFLFLSVNSSGERVGFLDPECRLELSDDLVGIGELGLWENELVPINVSFMGHCHVVIEENRSCSNSPQRVSSYGNLRGEENGVESGSPPDRLMSEMYQYFANRTSPCGDRAWRRQRRREKERQGRRKWEPEHFVKIVNCSPTPSRPLQGLWKVGICYNMNLDFFLVTYDIIGGIACRRVGDSSKPFSGYAPVFWTSNTTFVEPPFSPEEQYIYDSRIHLHPPTSDNKVVSRILCINSSYDLVIADLPGSTVNPRQVEGRIWQYENGTFGFGFLRDNYIIDLKHIAKDGNLLDINAAL